MAYEMLVGVEVTDEATYKKYRDATAPVLQSVGGSIGYDFRIKDVLNSKIETPINRVYTISFPDKEKKKHFFSHPDYVAAKQQFFDSSVAHTTVLAEYFTLEPET